MQLHVEALFTMNEKNELMTIREPWDSTSQPAPRFYLTRPLYEKPHTYFRADLHHIIKIETAKNGGNVKEVMDKALEEYIRKYLPDKL